MQPVVSRGLAILRFARRPFMKKNALFALCLVLALAAGFALVGWPGMTGRDPKLPAGGDFVLQSAEGLVDSKGLRGKVLLVFFGYTHCPDLAPLALSSSSQAFNALSAEERSRVRMLMVSVDPGRDTLARLKEYTAFFHPEMLGVTGSDEAVAQVAGAFGAAYRRQPAREDGSYVVDHTASTYVVGPDGRLSAVLELGAPVDKILSTVRGLL
jgi:protein SCO1